MESGNERLARRFLHDRPREDCPDPQNNPAMDRSAGERTALARRRDRLTLDRLTRDRDPRVIAVLLDNPVLLERDVVRIAAGRHLMSFSDQAMCFMAGANSIFTSERNMMLTDTTPCADHATDKAMLAAMGLKARVLEAVDA